MIAQTVCRAPVPGRGAGGQPADPGQLAPFTTADDTRFRGRPLSPVETAAATILTTQPATGRLALPIWWRLPSHAVGVACDAFYEIPFTADTQRATPRPRLAATYRDHQLGVMVRALMPR